MFFKPAFDEHLYRERQRIENLFARLKVYRRIANCYEKCLSFFAAMVSLACILIGFKL
jgi:transposase